MVVFKFNEKLKEYDSETLNKLHKVELMILTDFINLCEENNLKYFAIYGTSLGAIRHKGFIPWDDDVDVAMLREDYEKFLEIIGTGNNKYDFFAIENNYYHYKLFGKLNLKGTNIHDIWYDNADFNMGISIDIFILDYVPKNRIKKEIYLKRRFLHRKLSWLLEVLSSDLYLSENKEKIGHIIRKIFGIFGINQNFLLNQNKRLRNKREECDDVCELTDGYVFPKYIFDDLIKVPFEDIEITIPCDYDTYLKIMYGDYMTLPPIEERFNHAFDIDFGEYGDIYET